jgi:hypothetical protein
VKIVEDSKTAKEEQPIHDVHKSEKAIVPKVTQRFLNETPPMI